MQLNVPARVAILLNFIAETDFETVFLSFYNPFASFINRTPARPTVKGNLLLILGDNLAGFVKYSCLLSSKKNSLFLDRKYTCSVH